MFFIFSENKICIGYLDVKCLIMMHVLYWILAFFQLSCYGLLERCGQFASFLWSVLFIEVVFGHVEVYCWWAGVFKATTLISMMIAILSSSICNEFDGFFISTIYYFFSRLFIISLLIRCCSSLRIECARNNRGSNCKITFWSITFQMK